ncbi:MAG TPA: carbohydrate ABC transporter permease [Acidimicrobiales bacterium]|nr:carbohydrate ABC transporter permease [Acidimicrobiales bacterium]
MAGDDKAGPPSPMRLYGLSRRSLNAVTIACGVFAVFTLLPLWWVFVSASKTVPDLNSTFGFWFARPFVLFSNLEHVLTANGGVFLVWLRNTAIYAGLGALGATGLSAAAGYGFARFDFPGKSALFIFVMAALLIPVTVFAVPLYLIYAKVHMDSTMPGIFMPFMASPFSVYVMKVYVGGSVPKELIDAARVDGASEGVIFLRVACPLIVPALATVFMLNLAIDWNNYFLPFIINNNPHLNTLTQGLPMLGYGSLEVVAGLLTMVPLMVVFVALQRYWRGGLLLSLLDA